MSDGESKGRKDRPYWLPVVIAFGMWAWLTYLYFTPDAVDTTRFSFNDWKNIGYLVTVIMLAWLFIWKITLSTEVITEVIDEGTADKKAKPEARAAMEDGEEPEEETPPTTRRTRVVVTAPAAAAAAAAAGAADDDDELPPGVHPPKDVPEEDLKDLPRVIEWEKKEPGGVYSDTLIQVDGNLVLNLRTLLGKVCHNCEEIEDCRRRIEGKVDEEVFLWNFECKDGLKKELQKARKAREKEAEKAEAAKEMVEGKAASTKKKTTTKKKKSSGTKSKSTKKKSSSSSDGKKKTSEDK